MMMAVVAFSAFPILFKLGNAEDSPYLFTGMWLLSVGIGVGLAMLLFKWNLLIEPAVKADIKSHFNLKSLLKMPVDEGDGPIHKSGWLLGSVIGFCGFALLAKGLAYVNVSIAAILYEIWPLIHLLLMSYLFKGSNRFHPITWGTLIFAFLSLVGVAFVVFSQNENPQPLLLIGTDFVNSETIFGVSLVLMSAGCGAASGAFTLKIGAALATKHTSLVEKHRRSKGRGSEEFVSGEFIFVMVMMSVSLVIAGVLSCATGLIMSETLSMHQLLYAILGGLVVSSTGNATIRVANLKTKDLGVNALAYATPLVALVWLWIFSILDVPHRDYLAIGAMGIIASNLLINARADKRVAYSALVMSLWVFGTVLYFTDGSKTNVPLELPVTIFILVLAFRVDRLARRTNQEEEWVFEAFRKLGLLASKGKIDKETCETLLNIDGHKDMENLTCAYKKLAAQLANELEVSREDRDTANEISDIQHLVDKLVHSRQQGANFGEKVAIALAGTLIVTGLLFFNGVREFYSEFASFLLASVVVFLFFNILDLERDRTDSILEKVETGNEYAGRYIVKFDDIKSRVGQQTISVVTSAGIVFGFAWLFFGA